MGGISVIFLMGIFSVWVFVFTAIFATIVIFAVINYIFESISISCIGNKMNCSFKFISWIPFYNKFLLGKIGGNKIIGGILGILNLFIVLFGIYFFVNTKTNYIIVCIFILCLLLSFILDTILSNFSEGASVIISTHLISDIERILDEVIFIDKGEIILTSSADELRNKEKASIDEIFRRDFKC